MRGRDVYTIVSPILKALVGVLYLFPRPLVSLGYLFCRPIPTRIGIALRYILIKRLAGRCGDCVAIHENVYLHYIENMEFGDHVSIHPLCYLDGCGGLRIGTDVSIAHNSSIMTTNHDYRCEGTTIRDAPVIGETVVIEDNVWIGCGSRILAGVHIQSGSVVAAGAVVNRSVPGNVIVGGVPAKPLKEITKRAA